MEVVPLAPHLPHSSPCNQAEQQPCRSAQLQGVPGPLVGNRSTSFPRSLYLFEVESEVSMLSLPCRGWQRLPRWCLDQMLPQVSHLPVPIPFPTQAPVQLLQDKANVILMAPWRLCQPWFLALHLLMSDIYHRPCLPQLLMQDSAQILHSELPALYLVMWRILPSCWMSFSKLESPLKEGHTFTSEVSLNPSLLPPVNH